METHDRPKPFHVVESELPEPQRLRPGGIAPPDVFDPVIEAYKKDIDRTLGRPKDWEALAELEALLEERRKRGVDGTAP